MIDRTTAPDAVPAGGSQASDGITPALLGRVLAEAKLIQTMKPYGAPFWFEAKALAWHMNADENLVTQALGQLHARGDLVAVAHWPRDRAKACLVYALAEAFDNEPPEAG